MDKLAYNLSVSGVGMDTMDCKKKQLINPEQNAHSLDSIYDNNQVEVYRLWPSNAIRYRLKRSTVLDLGGRLEKGISWYSEHLSI